jgi:two-component system NarL family response regulator
MSGTASAARALTPVAPAAAVVGGEPAERGDVVRLLGDAGFGLHAEARPGALIVLLPDAREDARLRQVRTLAEAHPGATIVVVVPPDVPNVGLRRMLLAGACGIVCAADLELALVATARATLAGQLTVPSALGRLIAPRPLSHREKQILSLVVLGMTNREIAGRLFLAESTVKTHLSSAFTKLDAHSRAEVTELILDPDEGRGLGILGLADQAARVA